MSDAYRNLIDFFHKQDLSKWINLPEIAVMGDTSSGKSSLLTQLSEIEFPSDKDITTRCPMRLRMEKNQKTYAKVFIKWVNQPQQFEQIEIKNLELIKDAMIEAQEFILKNSDGKEVSQDIVEIEVFGPNFIDLTLIDLPGIVRTVGDNEDRSIIEDINNLIQKYLINERCVILAVVPANVDFHNSQIMEDAKKVDKETKRTIPVITKPDLIDQGAETAVLELLKGEKKKFSKGFHMVKCRGQKSLQEGQSIQMALNDEKRFFKEQSPWKDLENRTLLGTQELKKKLANLQIKMIKDSIPAIQEEAQQKKKEAQDELKLLGQDLDSDIEKRQFFTNLTDQILNIIQQVLVGNDQERDEGGFTWRARVQEIKNAFSLEMNEIDLNSLQKLKIGSQVIVQTDQGVIQGKLQSIHNNQGTVFLNDCLQSEQYNKTFTKSSLFGQSQQNIQLFNGDSFDLHKIQPSLNWLTDLIQKSQSIDLSLFQNSQIFNKIILQKIEQEITPKCNQLIKDNYSYLQKLLIGILDDFVPIQYPYLKQFVEQNFFEIALKLKKITEDQIDKMLKNEQIPYSQNDLIFETVNKRKNQEQQQYILSLFQSEPKLKISDIENKILNYFQELNKFSQQEQLAKEMIINLDAYGKIVTQRIIDNAPMTIESNLFQPLVLMLRNSCQVTDEQLRNLLNEDQDLIDKRQQAKQQLKVMESVEKAFINCLRGKY